MHIYSTKDFILAATLKALRCKYVGCEQTAPSKFAFQFEKTKDLDGLVHNFYNDDLCVSPHELANAQRILKSALRAQ